MILHEGRSSAMLDRNVLCTGFDGCCFPEFFNSIRQKRTYGFRFHIGRICDFASGAKAFGNHFITLITLVALGVPAAITIVSFAGFHVGL